MYCLIFGFEDNPLALSTRILVPIVKGLICNDFFQYHTSTTDLDLGLHVQCIVASLRLLSYHIHSPGSGMLNYTLFNEIYNRLSKWQQYHEKQSEVVEEDFRNVNTVFLLVYAKDLITSLPNDRTIWQNIGSRVVAALAAVGHV